jgi:hypothetical protein
MRYNYSAGIVYNTFIWPDCDESARKAVSDCAQLVLDARTLFGDASLADLYDPNNAIYFPGLVKAHEALDAAVEAAYGVDFGGDEERIVAHLFELYTEKTKGKE